MVVTMDADGLRDEVLKRCALLEKDLLSVSNVCVSVCLFLDKGVLYAAELEFLSTNASCWML